MTSHETNQRPRPLWALGLLAVLAAAVVAVAGTFMAVLGADIGCVGGSGSVQAAPTKTAKQEIAPWKLKLYRAAAKRFDIDWTFLASIGYQECGNGACPEINPSGCGGAMQIAVVRGSACSPDPSVPTLWERYGVDADGDGKASITSPADSIFTGARILRPVMGAPRTGGSYAAYREAACNYYGACADGLTSYADEVMARAVQYGFRGAGSPEPSDPAGARPAPSGNGQCGTSQSPSGGLGGAKRVNGPAELKSLPADITPGTPEACDSRIIADVIYLARRFGQVVTDCFGLGHTPDGEHPLGAAIDAAPKDGNWANTMRLARAVGWKPSCASSGSRPVCADPPFRFVGYNGYPNHGDPAHCVPCSGGPHIHISWQTSASPGMPENASRYSYIPATWIEVLAGPGSGGGSGKGKRG
ncbi:MAG: hypothetical protein J0H66_11690 [Solirubrobacterales bacterium]|nr:hypothetical protein [Solirubrobacterales bacterium]OJU94771.1 MAG: hypothetical protein BGO23_07905 [Solirubrobacterales bacterium 67-14]